MKSRINTNTQLVNQKGEIKMKLYNIEAFEHLNLAGVSNTKTPKTVEWSGKFTHPSIDIENADQWDVSNMMPNSVFRNR